MKVSFPVWPGVVADQDVVARTSDEDVVAAEPEIKSLPEPPER